MKARLENGNVKQYRRIPEAFLTVAEYLPTIEGHNLDPEGNELPYVENQIVKDARLLTDDNLKLFGFFELVNSSYDSRIQTVGAFYFDETEQIFKNDVSDKEFPMELQEYKDQLIAKYDAFLYTHFIKTDYHYIKQLELGTERPTDVLEFRAAVRERSAIVKAEINALETKVDVALYNLDSHPLGIDPMADMYLTEQV